MAESNAVAHTWLSVVGLVIFNVVYWPLISRLHLLDNVGSSFDFPFRHQVTVGFPFVVSVGVLYFLAFRSTERVGPRLITSTVLAALMWGAGLYGPFILCLILSGECV